MGEGPEPPRQARATGGHYDGRLLATCGLSVGLRLALAGTSLQDVALRRPELSTPLTSWKSLKEGVHLYRKGYDPYDGGSFHQSPLLLFPFSTVFPALDSPYIPAWFAAADVLSALLLLRIGRRKSELFPPRKLDREGDDAEPLAGWRLAAIFLLSPLTVLSSLARCTIGFSNLGVLAAIACALEGNLVLSAIALSIASQLSLYPFLLGPLLSLVLARVRGRPIPQTLALYTLAFVVFTTLTVLVSAALLPSSPSPFPPFLSAVYSPILTVPDLTPNIGLHWYFATEMFDHFRDFFGAVFQLHVAVYVAPLGIKFRRHPLFAIWMVCGIIATFKSYPSVGDTTLYISLLGVFPELISHMRHPLLTASLFLYSSLLLPTFHHLWLTTGSGNANFYYASTLVWTLANGALLVDGCYAMLRRVWEGEVKQARGKEIDQDGEMVVHG